jgi:tRNA(Ser,Leu) C12 N-acetylase TAN1
MPFFPGLLISCKRNFETSASSEIQYTLIEKLGIEKQDIKVKHTGISGLITVKITNHDPITIMRGLISLEANEAYFLHCLKFKFIQHVMKLNQETNFDEIKEYISSKIVTDEVTSSYKVEIEKRHSKYSSKDLIGLIAPLIPNPVNLSNPDWIVQIEIIADNIGISKIHPDHVFSSKLAFDDQEKKVENWFLD